MTWRLRYYLNSSKRGSFKINKKRVVFFLKIRKTSSQIIQHGEGLQPHTIRDEKKPL